MQVVAPCQKHLNKRRMKALISVTLPLSSCTQGEEGTHPSKRLVNQLLEMGFKVLTTAGSTLNRGNNAPYRG